MKIEDLKEKREQILGIAERHGARRVQIFGSLARGESFLQCRVDVVTQNTVSPYIRDEIVAQAVSL
jgi:predicted nucleotidyltransferase